MPSCVLTCQPGDSASRLAASPVSSVPPPCTKSCAYALTSADGSTTLFGSSQCSAPQKPGARLGSCALSAAASSGVMPAVTARGESGFGHAAFECGGRAERFQPAVRADEFAGAGPRDQRVVLDDAALDQRQHVARRRRVTQRCRFPPETREPRRECRQRRAVPVEIGRAVQRIAHQRERAARERIRFDRRALDQPRVAEARAFAGRAAIDEGDLAPAILQVECRGDADDACAENDDVEIHQW